MTIGCNIWMICLKLNCFFYGLSRMLQFSQFVWALSYSVLVVFNNFLLIDATDRSKISCDQKRFFIALSLYPLSFFANTPFKLAIHKFLEFFFFKILKIILHVLVLMKTVSGFSAILILISVQRVILRSGFKMSTFPLCTK